MPRRTRAMSVDARRGVVLGLGCLGPDSGLPALVFYDGSSSRVEPLFDDDALDDRAFPFGRA